VKVDHTDLLVTSLPNPLFPASKVKGLRGLEIGGPSPQLNSRGVYANLSTLDNINWNNKTIWGHQLTIEFNYYQDRMGRNFVMEATNLKKIRSRTYDIVLSSHSLEHIANPIKALKEWNRVTVPNGLLLLLLPKKDGNFDRNRPFTTLKHLLHDYETNVGEDDMTHFQEIIQLHDIDLDPWAGDIVKFAQRSLNNINNRALHHHVFCEDVIKKILNFSQYKVIKFDSEIDQFSILARKMNK